MVCILRHNAQISFSSHSWVYYPWAKKYRHVIGYLSKCPFGTGLWILMRLLNSHNFGSGGSGISRGGGGETNLLFDPFFLKTVWKWRNFAGAGWCPPRSAKWLGIRITQMALSNLDSGSYGVRDLGVNDTSTVWCEEQISSNLTVCLRLVKTFSLHASTTFRGNTSMLKTSYAELKFSK